MSDQRVDDDVADLLQSVTVGAAFGTRRTSAKLQLERLGAIKPLLDGHTAKDHARATI